MAAPSPTLPRGTRIKVGTVGSLERILFGPSHVTDGTENLMGALRQSMAALGARDIRAMQSVEMIVRACGRGRRQVLAARRGAVTNDELGVQLAEWGKVALLETSGRASGRVVRTAVGFVEDGADLLIAAGTELADWALNLRANPLCTITIEEQTADYIAREVDEDERGPAVVALILKYGTPAERLGRGPVFRLTRPEVLIWRWNANEHRVVIEPVRKLIAACLLLSLVAACASSLPSLPPTSTPSPAGSPTASASPEPPADIETAIAVREALGMRSDRDWVEQVQQDPASVLSNLGILLSAAELADLQQQQSMLDDRSALVAYGVRHADEYGGTYIDQPVGTQVMLFTGNLDAHRAAVALLPRGASVDVRPATFTEAELTAVMADLDFNELGRRASTSSRPA